METNTPHVSHLTRLGAVFAVASGRSLATVSNMVSAGWRFFQRLEQSPNAGCTRRTYERVLGCFDANWPEGLAWPADIPRPGASGAQRKRRAA